MAVKKPRVIQEINKLYGKRLQRIYESEFVNQAVQIYKDIGSKLTGGLTNANQLMSQAGDAKRLRGTIQPEHIGKLMLYFYDPEHKDKLPYFDRAPLIMPLSIDGTGFLGINFHYLHPLLRAQLLDAIMSDTDYDFLRNPEKARYDVFARTQLNMSYRKLQAMVASGLYKPCIKRYLWNNVRSRFYLIDPDDWVKLLPLPLERFEGSTKNNVWKKSLEEVFK